MLWLWERSNSAGINFRQVRSPAPPKMTNMLGSSRSLVFIALYYCGPSFAAARPRGRSRVTILRDCSKIAWDFGPAVGPGQAAWYQWILTAGGTGNSTRCPLPPVGERSLANQDEEDSGGVARAGNPGRLSKPSRIRIYGSPPHRERRFGGL